jgi:hypothetical protein
MPARDFVRKKRMAIAAVHELRLGGASKETIMPIYFRAMPTDIARAYQHGGLDAYGRPPEKRTADGASRVPCRHCLTDVAVGDEYLVLAYRPFTSVQPYAETGPIFLHAHACPRHADSTETPEMLLKSSQMIVRGYSSNERIIYGTGAVVATDRIADVAASLLDRPEVAFLHVRSATNNCFQCRIDSR